MNKRGLRYGALALMGAVCLSAGGLLVHADEKAETPVVSFGLQVLSGKTDVAVSAPRGNEVVFSAELFQRSLNLSRLDHITVASVPSPSAGELRLGSSRISEGEVISAENLAYMTFYAATDDVTHASFTFSANSSGTVLVCNVYLVDGINYTPTLATAAELSLNLTTHRDMRAYGCLSGYDPDGDGLAFEIVSYPKNGAVRIEDRALGTYVYTPASGYTGTDCFSYVARDKYGNYSASKTVNLRVVASGTSITYVDMEDSDAYNAALTLTEAGVMSGTQVGNRYYFYPEQGVSRADFLIMAMHAAGITEVPNADKTVFADDADIPKSMKGYVAAAYEMGYISGSLEDGRLCFMPNEIITRAQAAVMLSNIIGLCDVAVTPTFSDNSEIPVWAKEAIYSLNAAGILNSSGGYIAPTSTLTRAQTAQILAAAMEYVE